MAMLLSSLLLLIYTFSTCVNAEFSLPSQVTSFIPTCAQVCFESFVQDNFPPNICGDTPTLDCLCENGSKSTYTVGEGAVQCIMSEASVGFCNGDDSSNDIVLKAYNMCNSDKSALPNTHSTLTATLVLQSDSSIVQIAPLATTSASSSIATTLRTTAPTATATATSSSTIVSKSSTGVLQPAAATSASSSSEKGHPLLSTAQIAGIVVAGVSGIVLAVVAILLFACLRRKRQANRDSGYLPFQQEPSMSIKSQSHYGISKPIALSPASVSTRGPTPIGPFLGARMPPRAPLRGDQLSPDPFFQRNATPGGIGLAMTSGSPQNNLLTPMDYTEVFQRGPSPLLPERPALTLHVPFQPNSNNIHTTAYQQPSNLADNNRQSMYTQFEDEDSCSTAVASEAPWNAALYGSTSNEKVLQQPGPAYYQSSRLQGELSPNVTERIINAYKDPSVEPDFYVRPLNVQRNFSQPSRPENAINPPVSHTISVKDPFTASSSVYSVKPRTRRPSSVEVDRLSPLMQSNPSFRRVPRKSAHKTPGPFDQNRTPRASVGSMTSFETIDSINPEPEELAGDTNLSPVVESPSDNQHGIGKSPVKYPKIKGNSHRHSRTRTRPRTSTKTNRPAPPPISIESPTNPPRAHINKPWQEAEITAQKLRMSSLGLSPGNYLSPGSHNSGIMIRKSSDFFNPTSLASRSSPPPILLPLPPNTRQRDNSPVGMSGGNGKRNAPPAPLTLTSSSSNSTQPSKKWRVLPSDYPQTTPQNSDSIAIKSPPYRPQVLPNISKKDSAHSLNTHTQNNHSLSDPKVSSVHRQETWNFTFDPRMTQMTTISDFRAQGQAPDPNSSNNFDSASNTETNLKSTGYTETERSGQIIMLNIENENSGALPKTPGWVPKLTPTRRGNDLFLNVQ